MSINQLLEKEVTRTEFLRHIGLAFLALVGVTSLLKSLETSSQPKRSGGYGRSSYGR